MIENVLKKINAPGPEFRGAPFWAWNAKLEPQELRRQIRLMKDMGIGGFFMHARVGLNTPYLSKEWFDCIRACIDEAKKLDMKAWLYDEDRWPSGAAGGLVTKDPKYRQRKLEYEQLESVPKKLSADTIGVFAAVVNGDQASRVRKFNIKKDKLKKGESLLVFKNNTFAPNSWFNDQTYLDTMNPEAVKKFIQVTHESYRKNIASDFGKTVPGIFTDEPNYIHGGPTNTRPWTNALPAEFKKMYGYDILDHLPEIFFHVDGQVFSKARLNYYNTATTLYVNAFPKLYGDWCKKHDLMFTGHNLAEDSPVSQTYVCGATMRFYEYQQQPGIDLLTEHWGIFDTAKQCSSMAHQFGRQWRLSETYGCTGWDFPFMGHKALGDWQFAEGINFRCQHLAWYSMAAEAKRDYPASISYQSPWYKNFNMVEDYFGRLGAALSEGEEQRDLLVIHPIESTWAVTVFTKGSEKWDSVYEEASLYTLSNKLLAGKLDFDYGDEEVMSRYSKVVKNTITVNKASYKAVLLPKLRTIRKTTLELLVKFAKAGGKVFYLGPVPEYLDGEKSQSLKKAYASFQSVSDKDLIKAMEPVVRRVSIADKKGAEIEPALYILRKAEDHQTLFFCNYGVNFGKQSGYPLVRDRKLAWDDVTVQLKAAKNEKVFELDLMSGNISAVKSSYKNGALVFKTSLPALDSRLFFTSLKDIANALPKTLPVLSGKSIALPATDWKVETDDFNVFVFDHAEYTVDGKPCGKEFIMKLDDKLREEHLKVRPRGGAMVQPWLSANAKTPSKTLDLKLDYRFQCAVLPETECFFAVERPDLYSIEVNGAKLKMEDRGWWCDICMRRIAIPAKYFRIGENVITLRSKYHQYLPGLEMAYLLGNFGVTGETLTAPVEKLSIGDWCSQGLQNYAGNLTYSTSIELNGKDKQPCVLEIGDWRGVALAVSVNGSGWKTLPWPPFKLDVSELLKNGKNVISIRVFGHRRNSHGPFYDYETWPSWTGPEQFKNYIGGPVRKLVPCGLLETPILKF